MVQTRPNKLPRKAGSVIGWKPKTTEAAQLLYCSFFRTVAAAERLSPRFPWVKSQLCCSVLVMWSYLQGYAVLLQSSERRVRLTDAHCLTSSLDVVQPQQQRMEAFMELLHEKIPNQHLCLFTCESSINKLL